MKQYGIIPRLEFPKIENILREKTEIRVRSEVVFGSPGKNCAGYGVCMLTGRGSLKKLNKPCPVIDGVVVWNKDIPDKLILEVGRGIVDSGMGFDGSLFWVEEPFLLPVHLTKDLGMHDRRQILAGAHVLVCLKDKWRIYFDITQTVRRTT